jgi:hypothetical protein
MNKDSDKIADAINKGAVYHVYKGESYLFSLYTRGAASCYHRLFGYKVILMGFHIERRYK